MCQLNYEVGCLWTLSNRSASGIKIARKPGLGTSTALMSDVAVRIVEQTIAPCLAIRLYLRIEDFVLSFGMFVSVLA